MADLNVGDKIIVRHGPYEAVATVTETNDNGAILSYAPTATFVGWNHPASIDGRQLAPDTDHGWLGRAHWAAARRV
jgi:hypothetical protein